MKKNIYFNYGYKSTQSEKALNIFKAGFDGVFLFANKDFEENVRLVRQYNLDIETIHLPFNKVCNSLWEEGELGDTYILNLIEWIKKAHDNNIDKVIFHTSQNPHPEIVNDVGKNRFKQIVKACEEYNVYLCVENIRHLDLMDLCLGLTDSKYVVGCFDCGHANAFTKNIEVYDFKKYQNIIRCLHLHDNNGENDEHLPIGEGNINFKKLMKELKMINYQGPLTLELLDKVEKIPEKQFLKNAYESLCLLEKYYNDVK